MLTVDFMSRALSDAQLKELVDRLIDLSLRISVTVITLHFAVSLKMRWENRDY